MVKKEAISFRAAELAQRGRKNLPEELISNTHLIYSSPAALAFNSPGAEGFGVKRAALSIPGSVMLLVSPGCCGRNTSLVSRLPGYENRFFFLQMTETDIVTGRHLKKIPKRIEEIYESLTPKPSVIMICITCVDALLGTDMERVCRMAEERVGIPVRPSYMYALTREGRKPPMVHVRQSLYSLLTPKKKKGTSVNLLGFFAPLEDDCELYSLLHAAGVKKIREISRCRTYEEFLYMSEANFNLVLNPEARPAAKDFEERLSVPSIELRRLYQPDKIHSQYQALARVLGIAMDDEPMYQKTRRTVKAFREKYGNLHFSVGECMNGDPFELSLALVRMGFFVNEIFGTVTEENFIYIEHLSILSPDTRIYSNLEPTMIYYDRDEEEKNTPGLTIGRDGEGENVFRLTIGKDAGYYHPGFPNVSWNSDIQPFGFSGVCSLFEAMDRTLSGKEQRKPAEKSEKIYETTAPSLTPFAPDQSGAVSVLYELGGIEVICDAGGCVGNICGFDEPRWFGQKSAVFSAGLRDMDAILGRDDRLVAKLLDARKKVEADFAAIIGTPVPSVIGTDYHALRRMAEKKTGLPILCIDTNGMEAYDVGEEKAYLELLRVFIKTDQESSKAADQKNSASACTADSIPAIYENALPRVGVWGLTPLDFTEEDSARRLKDLYKEKAELVTYGRESTLEDLANAGRVRENLVVSPAGLEAARLMKEKYGIPYTISDPLAKEKWQQWAGTVSAGENILIVAQQVTAGTIRELLKSRGCQVTAGSFFMQKKEIKLPGDLHFKNEQSFGDAVLQNKYTIIIADEILKILVPGFAGTWIDLPHFALSGRWDMEITPGQDKVPECPECSKCPKGEDSL